MKIGNKVKYKKNYQVGLPSLYSSYSVNFFLSIFEFYSFRIQAKFCIYFLQRFPIDFVVFLHVS